MYNYDIEHLEWDSVFFEKKIGRILAENTCNLENILDEAKNTGYQLIYAFGNRNFFVDVGILKQFNGHLADRKVVYEKKIEHAVNETPFVSEYNSIELTAELEELAYISGEYSRFKTDKNLQDKDFYRMYKIWIENSVKHLIADNVFVVTEDNNVKGMVTLKIDNEKGKIGLIAVSPDTQGKGYGKKLISACENKLLNKGIYKIEVPTQADNKQACSFYEKCGFQISEIINIYHFWLKA